MMQFKTYKTLWGNCLPFAQVCQQALASGFSGLEGSAPNTQAEMAHWRSILQSEGAGFILEVVTGGDYVPHLDWTPQQHLDDIERQIHKGLSLNPNFVTLITGSDGWSESQMIDFLGQAMLMAQKYGIPLSFETHRSRCLFNPWLTERIVQALPDMQLTLDMSHWCVVCERVLTSDIPSLKSILTKVWHIHGRVGYAQGPQVPHPAAPEYQAALQMHQRVWEVIWKIQAHNGRLVSTMTPEFGPDGYGQQVPFTQAPVADIDAINVWMSQQEHLHFAKVMKDVEV